MSGGGGARFHPDRGKARCARGSTAIEGERHLGDGTILKQRKKAIISRGIGELVCSTAKGTKRGRGSD